jgi:hypothetical protein
MAPGHILSVASDNAITEIWASAARAVGFMPTRAGQRRGRANKGEKKKRALRNAI